MKVKWPTRLKISGDFGRVWISESIDASKPDTVGTVRYLFERQTNTVRRQNAHKSIGVRMAIKFAKRIL